MTYCGTIKSAIVIPIAPAKPAFESTYNKAAKTRKAFPKCTAVVPAGKGISILRYSKPIKLNAHNKAEIAND